MTHATLLLVDDHEVVRAGIRNALETLPDIQVVGELDNGPALFQFLTQQQPDCLLIDVSMPDFDPINDIGKIHLSYPLMKILVVSAYDDDVYVQGLLSIGVDGYHLKDQPLTDLRLAVQRVLAGEKWVSSRLVDQLVKGRERTEHIHITHQQRTILRCLYKGLDNRSIASEMGLSIKTVENHLTRLYKQINVRSRLEAVNYAMQHPELLAMETGELSQPSNSQPPKGGSPHQTVMVVDDNMRYRHQLIKMIGTVSPRVLVYEAGDMEQATMLAQQIKPMLALVDVVLGDENGIHCLKQIRRVSSRSKVILFSAYPDMEFHRQGIEAGAMAFIDKKNLDLHTLTQILQDIGVV